MCGITGMVRGARQTGGLDDIEAMTSALRHRGPDAGAIFVDEDAGVALGHRRLAVVESVGARRAADVTRQMGAMLSSSMARYTITASLRRELERRRQSQLARLIGHRDADRMFFGMGSVARRCGKRSGCSPSPCGTALSGA